MTILGAVTYTLATRISLLELRLIIGAVDAPVCLSAIHISRGGILSAWPVR